MSCVVGRYDGAAILETSRRYSLCASITLTAARFTHTSFMTYIPENLDGIGVLEELFGVVVGGTAGAGTLTDPVLDGVVRGGLGHGLGGGVVHEVCHDLVVGGAGRESGGAVGSVLALLVEAALEPEVAQV
eukprot:scaffold24258_cov47-Attheya_sp.AAC.6